MAVVARFEVYLVNLDDEPSNDPKNTRPCVIVSPDELNRNVKSVIVAPMSSVTRDYPTRITLTFLNAERAIVLDQIRTVDKVRLVKKIGDIDNPSRTKIIERLQELFAE